MLLLTYHMETGWGLTWVEPTLHIEHLIVVAFICAATSQKYFAIVQVCVHV